MGAVAAVAGALAGFFALVLYIYKRYDEPSAVCARHEDELDRDLEAFDDALGETDEDALTGSYADMYNRMDLRMRPRPDGDNAGGQDNAQP